MSEWRPLVRDLLRVAARVRAAPPLSTLLRSGIVRRDARSEAAVALQAACAAPGLDVRSTILQQFREGSRSSAALDDAFDALRRLNRLDAALARFRGDGAFGAAPPRSAAGVRFVVGQPLYHRVHGRCVAYGWEPGPNGAVEPADAAALAAEPVVDNRRWFAGIDGGVSRDQPYYRVLRADGVALLCAQELLEAVPDPRLLEQPVRGSSYFFTGADPATGALVPNDDLAARFPEDARLLGDPDARVDLLAIDSTAKYAQLWLASWRKLGRDVRR